MGDVRHLKRRLLSTPRTVASAFQCGANIHHKDTLQRLSVILDRWLPWKPVSRCVTCCFFCAKREQKTMKESLNEEERRLNDWSRSQKMK